MAQARADKIGGGRREATVAGKAGAVVAGDGCGLATVDF